MSNDLRKFARDLFTPPPENRPAEPDGAPEPQEAIDEAVETREERTVVGRQTYDPLASPSLDDGAPLSYPHGVRSESTGRPLAKRRSYTLNGAGIQNQAVMIVPAHASNGEREVTLLAYGDGFVTLQKEEAHDAGAEPLTRGMWLPASTPVTIKTDQPVWFIADSDNARLTALVQIEGGHIE